ncbi:hypothetical protein M3Y94_00916000 [Aphelenchoides besseyi]|nr:hypothetical protein M3Y94_00916000 [Aphelenchoides besseyi]
MSATERSAEKRSHAEENGEDEVVSTKQKKLDEVEKIKDGKVKDKAQDDENENEAEEESGEENEEDIDEEDPEEGGKRCRQVAIMKVFALHGTYDDVDDEDAEPEDDGPFD